MRRFAVLAMLVAAWAAVTPTQSFAASAGRPMECAGYTILRFDAQGDTGPSSRVVIRHGQSVVKTLTGDRITEIRCDELTGDGSLDLSIERYSGGAHCCTTIQILQLRPALRQILMYGAGHTSGFTVVRDRGSAPALVLGDSSLAYYGDLCFACSPSSMPLVACYTSTRYVDCTRRFPNVVQEAIKTYTDSLREAIRSKDASRVEYMRGAALGVYAAHALLDRDAEGLTAVRRMVTEPAVTSWLTAQRNPIRKWLKGRPAALVP